MFVTNLKIKNLTLNELTVAIDRLTRFKYTEDKYLRVFKEIILSNLIEPKFKKKDLNFFDYNSLKCYAQEILNKSIAEFSKSDNDNNFTINKKIYEYENRIFNLNDEINILLDNEINFKGFLPLIYNNSSLNLKWLKSLDTDNKNDNNLRFPIKLVVIAEGITEETLLPIFAQKCGYDFDKYGIQIISAGGKNQVVKLFYKFAEQLKIPIFVLLDNDAKDNFEQIKQKIRPKDKIHLINGGEFEDILPRTLIEKTLNDYMKNLNSVNDDDFKYDRMVQNLEEIFKSKGFHEFKKSEFAGLVKEHVNCNEDISDEIRSIVDEIKLTLSCELQ